MITNANASTNTNILIELMIGALGLIFAKWMIERKAMNVVLLSRSGQPPADCKANNKHSNHAHTYSNNNKNKYYY